MLASWRGTRFEVVNVLREVCDRVLKDSTVTDQELFLRAKVHIHDGLSFPVLRIFVGTLDYRCDIQEHRSGRDG